MQAETLDLWERACPRWGHHIQHRGWL